MLSEPISPELVLVDPELARRARAELVVRAYHAPPVLRITREQVEPEVGVMSRAAGAVSLQRALRAAFLCALFVSGFIAAKVVLHPNDASIRAAAPAPKPSAPVAVAATAPPASPRAIAERKVMSLLLAAPPGKLPKAFVDESSGLIANNVQVACRRAKQSSFLCTVRSPTDAARKALVVRYRVSHGKSVFHWIGYKK